MALPTPRLVRAQAVLGLPAPIRPDQERDKLFIQAVKPEFPNVLTHQLLPPDAPPQAPRLVLAGSSSQVAVSAVQADFQVAFYGDYLDDFGRGLEYVERKLVSIRSGLEAAELTPTTVGLVAAFQFQVDEVDGLSPAAHIKGNLLKVEIDPDDTLQDATAKVAVRVRDTYFVNLTLSNYEQRLLERPLMPGMGPIRVRPWEGRVEAIGLELVLDINNNLEAQVKRADPIVTDEGIRAVTRLLRETGETIGPQFAETGRVSVEALAAGATA